jgi:hypothetical protein
MKKIGLVIISLLLATSCFPQSEEVLFQKWVKSKIESDELKGTPAYDVFTYVDLENNGSITLWSIKDDDFRIKSLKSIFKSNGQKGSNLNNLVVGLVGFYDEQDHLIEKFDKFPFEEDGHDQMDIVHPNKYTLKGGNNKKKAKQIIDYLLNKKGYIRFVLPLYGGGNLDFKVMCMNNN